MSSLRARAAAPGGGGGAQGAMRHTHGRANEPRNETAAEAAADLLCGFQLAHDTAGGEALDEAGDRELHAREHAHVYDGHPDAAVQDTRIHRKRQPLLRRVLAVQHGLQHDNLDHACRDAHRRVLRGTQLLHIVACGARARTVNRVHALRAIGRHTAHSFSRSNGTGPQPAAGVSGRRREVNLAVRRLGDRGRTGEFAPKSPEPAKLCAQKKARGAVTAVRARPERVSD